MGAGEAHATVSVRPALGHISEIAFIGASVWWTLGMPAEPFLDEIVLVGTDAVPPIWPPTDTGSGGWTDESARHARSNELVTKSMGDDSMAASTARLAMDHNGAGFLPDLESAPRPAHMTCSRQTVRRRLASISSWARRMQFPVTDPPGGQSFSSRTSAVRRAEPIGTIATEFYK